jgi:hypothetical protein
MYNIYKYIILLVLFFVALSFSQPYFHITALTHPGACHRCRRCAHHLHGAAARTEGPFDPRSENLALRWVGCVQGTFCVVSEDGRLIFPTNMILLNLLSF